MAFVTCKQFETSQKKQDEEIAALKQCCEDKNDEEIEALKLRVQRLEDEPHHLALSAFGEDLGYFKTTL